MFYCESVDEGEYLSYKQLLVGELNMSEVVECDIPSDDDQANIESTEYERSNEHIMTN